VRDQGATARVTKPSPGSAVTPVFDPDPSVPQTRAVADHPRDAVTSPPQAWATAFDTLSAADRVSPLPLDDLERLAEAAYLTGHLAEGVDAWTRAHTDALGRGDVPRAVRSGFWAAFALLNNGEPARGSGWIDRGRRLLDDGGLDVVERGYIDYCAALRAALDGEAQPGYDGFSRASETGARFVDRQLMTLARVGLGRCAIYLGRGSEGVALLDEAMVSVGAHEVSPIAAGDIYCTVIEGCQELFDLRRVREWTAALSHWCDAQPGLVIYHGQCLVHRAEILQLQGEWQEAAAEADRACARLVTPKGQPAIGPALYLRAELHRLRGEHDQAERVYARAFGSGRDPQPGLALLRLGQGRTDAAQAAIGRALEGCEDPVSRCRLLAAHVEISLAAGDVASARAAAEDLATVAEELNAPYLRAQAATVTGAVLLDLDDLTGAAAALRRAATGWQDLEAPYELARTRVLLGSVYRRLGDQDGEALELEAAARVFRELGAMPDLERLAALTGSSARAGPLSARELDVLRLVASGKSNRAIAHDLVISEKTVARHLSNIFTKLDLTSRSAATAYAYEHGIVGSG
jgi:ATP/maltotriose-dependent transcriptional regulator MalT